MRLEVLGCHGGELPGCRTTCFLVDDVLALDAGALAGALPLERLVRVDHVLVGHSHLDHVKDLPLMADLVIGRRSTPITVWASEACAATLRGSLFNDALWPDFTRIPSARRPVLRIRTFRAGSRFTVGRYRVQSVPVNHPVESCAFVVSDGTSTLAMSGDTGPTDQLWRVLNRTKDLGALLVETSFPDAQQAVADASGHLTPATLARELEKLRRRDGTEVMVYHLKPAFVPELQRELGRLPVRVLGLGDVFEL